MCLRSQARAHTPKPLKLERESAVIQRFLPPGPGLSQINITQLLKWDGPLWGYKEKEVIEQVRFFGGVTFGDLLFDTLLSGNTRVVCFWTRDTGLLALGLKAFTVSSSRHSVIQLHSPDYLSRLPQLCILCMREGGVAMLPLLPRLAQGNEGGYEIGQAKFWRDRGL